MPSLSRRQFLKSTAAAWAVSSFNETARASSPLPPGPATAPRCIAMWDFSWIERRWPGAGFEDWPLALDELVERGSMLSEWCFPHLVSSDPNQMTSSGLSVNDWGSPALNNIVCSRD